MHTHLRTRRIPTMRSSQEIKIQKVASATSSKYGKTIRNVHTFELKVDENCVDCCNSEFVQM